MSIFLVETRPVGYGNHMKRIPGALSIVAISTMLLALTACDSGTIFLPPVPTTSATAMPTSSPSSTPTPTPTPVAAAASVIVDGDSVSVIDSGGALMVDIPFSTDPATAVAQLNSAIGLDGVPTTLPATGCFHQRPQATWGGLSFIWGDDWQRAPGSLFLASVKGPESASGVPITIPSGQKVGSSQADTLAGNPSAHVDDFGAWINLHYDIKSGVSGGNPDTYYGAGAVIEGGVLKSFASPIHFNYDC